MRIGIDARMIDWAGVGRYTRNLLGSLVKIDTENEYVLFCHQQSRGLIPAADNFRVQVVSQPIFSMSSQLSWAREVSKTNLSIFHSPSFVVPLLFTNKSIVTMHDLIPFLFPDNLPTKTAQVSYTTMIKLAIKRSSRIIAVSEHTKQDILNNFDISDDKVTVIYEAADANYRVLRSKKVIDETLQRYGLHDKYFLWVGNYKPYKNVVRLIQAYGDLIKDRAYADVKLVLVGPRDKRFPEPAKMIAKLGLEGKAIQTGYVPEDDLVALYNAARGFLLPSIYEGFGLTALEAMACGTPVICSNKSSLPEIAEEAALFVDPENVDDINKAMKQLLDDERLCIQLSQKGQKQAKKFSWQKTATQTLKIYNLVTNDSQKTLNS